MSDVRVVVGIDGSSSALDAVGWAADEAARRDAPLHAVHASVWGQVGPGQSELADPVVASAEQRAAYRQPRLDVCGETVLGMAEPVLLAQAETAGLLVLGSRGLGRPAKAVLGSVSLPVVARAACPVVVVREGVAVPYDDELPVVVGVAGRGTDAAAVGFAFEEAAARNCAVRAVHAWSVPRAEAATAHTGHYDDARRAHSVAASDALDDAVREIAARFPDVPLHLALGEERAAASLLDAAREAALLVVGAHRRRPAGPRLGAVCHAALHHAPCPVAVVPLEAPGTARDGRAER